LSNLALFGWFSQHDNLGKVVKLGDHIWSEPLFPNDPTQQWRVFHGLSQTDIDKIAYIHMAFGRSLVPFEDLSDTLWFGPGGNPAKAVLIAECLSEILDAFGNIPADALRKKMPMILARGWSRLLAGDQTEGINLSGMSKSDVQSQAVRRPYSNYFAIEEHDIKTRRFDGKLGPQVERAVLMAPDAVVILPYDPVRDRVLVVEQIRVAPWVRGDLNPWQLEPIAGRIDASESPEQAARREALEETGLSLSSLKLVGQSYPTPGTSTEYYYMYIAVVDLPDGVTGVHGLEDEAEDIKSHLISFEQLDAYAEALQISNLALLSLTQWLGRYRNRLMS